MTVACRTGLAVAFTACAAPHPVQPLPSEVIEFPIPWESAFPSDVVVDDLGRLWFTDRMTHVIGRLDPEAGAFERFAPPTPKSAPYGFVRGPDGALWYAASKAGLLGRVDPSSGDIVEYPLAGVSGGPQLLAVQGRRIWFTLRDAPGYGSYEIDTGQTHLFAAPERMRPYGITADRRGRVWVAAYSGSTLLEIDAATDSVREHDLSWARAESNLPAGIPDSVRTRLDFRDRARLRRVTIDASDVVWLTDFGGGRVLAFAAATAEVTQFPSLARNAEPYGIVAASSGMVWYNEKNLDLIVALNPADGTRTRFRIPTAGAAVRHIAIDVQRDRVWLPLSDRGRIGLIELQSSTRRQRDSMR
jgi:virginiamycin B lyase